ncbi:hypothetical protein KTO58_14560 [Chitinophaga pendula]|uniref:hypothetical protein n=1 Tax=Chitinophaga TaxID=79328 RepID=UPI000BB06881|nr:MULTISPECIES: hypothetical protein [Chitinophaga]ASZ12044.1 hypothetical protein CK934_14275 [Chitinophaga sp. MD30]UCJ04923.1 hypothetical protein KTO58_14560 [Chitinophaga pendula]
MTANRIVQHIFNQPDLTRVDEAALEQLVADYPFFTAARLLQAKKHYNSYNNLHAAVIKKAQLYSNNPHYFYQFIAGALPTVAGPETADTVIEEVSAGAPTPPVAAPLSSPVVKTVTDSEEDWPDDDLILPEDEHAGSTTGAPAGVTADGNRHETSADEVFGTAISEQQVVVPVTEEAVKEEEEEEEIPAEERQVWTAKDVVLADDLGLAPDQEMKLIEKDELVPADDIDHEAEMVATAANIRSSEEAAAVAPDTEEEGPIKIYPLEIPATTADTLTFQPLYTEDYFAYKRLKSPDIADDLNEKGMAEMRSFTDWLRDMKDSFAVKASKDWYHSQLHRIYEDEDPEVSETVERMAMSSITLNEDIVSETLAEIWAKQQQYHTAIQIYQKLSLLNPDKNAYFAQKIKELQLKTDKK